MPVSYPDTIVNYDPDPESHYLYGRMLEKLRSKRQQSPEHTNVLGLNYCGAENTGAFVEAIDDATGPLLGCISAGNARNAFMAALYGRFRGAAHVAMLDVPDEKRDRYSAIGIQPVRCNGGDISRQEALLDELARLKMAFSTGALTPRIEKQARSEFARAVGNRDYLDPAIELYREALQALFGKSPACSLSIVQGDGASEVMITLCPEAGELHADTMRRLGSLRLRGDSMAGRLVHLSQIDGYPIEIARFIERLCRRTLEGSVRFEM